MSTVLVFSRDPAPTNLLIAVMERLRTASTSGDAPGLMALRQRVGDRIINAVVATRQSSAQLWKSAGFDAQIWRGDDKEAAIELLRGTRAGVLLTGTSDSDETGNQTLWDAARQLGIESHVVLDHPAGLDIRFRDPDGRRILPDWIYVPDEIFRERAIADGLPRDKVLLLGDVHQERLSSRAQKIDPREIPGLRRNWGAKDKDVVVVFVSECMREMKRLNLRNLQYDYDEVERLQEVLAGIEAGTLPGGASVNASDVLVIVRPHPRDDEGKYDSVISSRKTPPHVKVSKEGDAVLAIAAADLVVGMTSSLLYEAKALGYPVHSLIGVDLSVSKSSL